MGPPKSASRPRVGRCASPRGRRNRYRAASRPSTIAHTIRLAPRTRRRRRTRPDARGEAGVDARLPRRSPGAERRRGRRSRRRRSRSRGQEVAPARLLGADRLACGRPSAPARPRPRPAACRSGRSLPMPGRLDGEVALAALLLARRGAEDQRPLRPRVVGAARSRAAPAAARSASPTRRPGAARCPGSRSRCRRRRGSTTRLPRGVELGPELRRRRRRGSARSRKSIASTTPVELAPGTSSSRGAPRADGDHAPRRGRARSSSQPMSRADVDAVSGTRSPSASSSSQPAIEDRLLHLEVGDAVAQQAAGASARSNTVTAWPAWLSCAAAASPAGPQPTTATRLPVRARGRPRRHPALGERALDDLLLDLLDGHRRR